MPTFQRRRPSYHLTVRVLRNLLTLIGILAPIAVIAHAYPTLPASLPSHFNAAGHANRFAPKAIVWLMPAVAIMMVILITVAARFPRIFNLPAPVGDPARPRQEALAVELFAWLRLELVWTFAYVAWSVVRVGLKHSTGLREGFIPMAMLGIISTVVFFIRRMILPPSV